MTWCHRFKLRKSYKKDKRKELIPVRWHPTKCWDWCFSEDEKQNCFSLIKVSINLVGSGKE